MSEGPRKPESKERELSIEEFLGILRKKYNPSEDLIEAFEHHLKFGRFRFFKVSNLYDKFVEQQAEWYDDEIMPLYDKGTNIFITMPMGGHVSTRYYLYDITKSVDLGDVESSADNWIKENMGWFVSGGDFTSVKSSTYRGTKQEEEIFANHTYRVENLEF